MSAGDRGARTLVRAAVVTLAFWVVCGDAFAAGGEVRRVEAVGIYGIRDAMRTKVIPRDEAIANARWEGVSRVALELIGESGPSGAAGELEESGASAETASGDATAMGRIEAPLEQGGETGSGAQGAATEDVRLDRVAPTRDEVALLSTVLGRDMLPYTRGFRILEDQGEVPVLFDDVPGVETEYVVVVEVGVDVDRVAQALEEAGLVLRSGAAPEVALTLEVIGLARYGALERVLSALQGPLGATRVTTLEFERERQLLAVEGPFDAEALAARLADFDDPRLVLEPIALDPVYGRLRVLARWFPATDEAEGGRAQEGAGR